MNRRGLLKSLGVLLVVPFAAKTSVFSKAKYNFIQEPVQFFSSTVEGYDPFTGEKVRMAMTKIWEAIKTQEDAQNYVIVDNKWYEALPK